MKFFRFIFWLIISVALLFLLNKKQGSIPPAGKLLDPFQGFWANAETEILDIDKESLTAGLHENVTVQYEDNLIPHIYAQNDHDLYFTQGYLTAYHRLWQMEFVMYVAAGRVSEILGPNAIEFDRRQRRKGLVYGAENSLFELEKDETVREFLNAYAAGVNAFIGQLKFKDYPIEYKILDYEPEEWTPLKSVLLLKYMADDLSGSDRDLQNTNAYQLLGRERFDFLFPDMPAGIDPIIPKGTKWDFDPVQVNTPDSFAVQSVFSPASPVEEDPGIGSNNWAISREKSATGNPMLCNDPHLRFSLPSIWFAQQLNAPGINSFGVTIPGLPGILLGFNDSLAWGLTNAPRDVRDWYQITFKDYERDEYLYDGKWLKTQKRIETIRVRGEKAYYDTVLYTHYGPIFYDRNFMGNDDQVNFSLKWTAHNPSKEILTVYLLGRTKNLKDIEKATQYFECPPQNMVVATRGGDIGMFIEGKFPLKWKGQGKFLMDGSDPKYEWQGFIPREHNAKIVNPTRGFVSSANQHPFDSLYPYFYYNNNEEHYRNRRINDYLSGTNSISIDDMKKLQNDTYYLLAAETLPAMLSQLDSSDLKDSDYEIMEMLSSWDYYTKPSQVPPSYFEAWWHFIITAVWDDFTDENAYVKPDKYITSQLIINHPDDPAFDIQITPETETISDIMTKTFHQAIDSLESWKKVNNESDAAWYKFKNTRLMHLTRIEPFSKLKVETGGNKSIVNANGPDWGASWRLVVDLGDEINAWGIYPGGQNGNPASRHYTDFVDDWAIGNYFKINFWEAPVTEEIAFKTYNLNK